jgi:hypothetical protein
MAGGLYSWYVLFYCCLWVRCHVSANPNPLTVQLNPTAVWLHVGYSMGMGVTGMAGMGMVWRCATRSHTVPVSTVYGYVHISIPGKLCIIALTSITAYVLHTIATLTAVKHIFSQGQHLLHFTQNCLSPSSTHAFLSWLSLNNTLNYYMWGL